LTAPTGWVEDAEKRIADPSAKRPEDWDDEEDGEWEAPVIDNPDCKVGCGKYEAPAISNPEYKGKWHAPKIDNPEYVGIWTAKQIANPDYFYDETPYLLPKIDSVGIDIWTMSGGMLFDNIAFAKDAAKAQLFAEQTFQVRQKMEEMQMPKPQEGWATWIMAVIQNNFFIVLGICVVPLLALAWCCLGGQTVPPPPTPKKKEEDKKAEKKEKKDEKDADGAAASSSGSAGLTKRSKKTEGGIGDLDGEDS
jgi:hypothetical protein